MWQDGECRLGIPGAKSETAGLGVQGQARLHSSPKSQKMRERMNEKEEGWGWARVLSSGPTSKWNQGREEIEERKRKKEEGRGREVDGEH